MDELQQLFSFDTDEKEYKGIMRLFRNFEGHWLMEIAVDLAEESTASRKVLPWRDDRLPRLLPGDLHNQQSFLINEFRAAFTTGMIKADERIYGARLEVPLHQIIEFDKILDQRIAEQKEKGGEQDG